MATESNLSADVVPNDATSLGATLEAFAAGAAVPGSGSANALVAALAAALTTSVAKKTREHGDELRYRAISDAANETVRLCTRLRHELIHLADRDAKAFAPVIALRREAKTLREKYDRDRALRREIQATKPATTIPLRIAEVAIAVAERALLMLERGFVPARGESYSAAHAALAAADGALYVARLNIAAIAKKVETLDDPEYERPWLKRITSDVNHVSTQLREKYKQQRALQARYTDTKRARIASR